MLNAPSNPHPLGSIAAEFWDKMSALTAEAEMYERAASRAMAQALVAREKAREYVDAIAKLTRES